MMQLKIHPYTLHDLTKQTTDAIVGGLNGLSVDGGGDDGAIHRAAGDL